MTSWLAFSQSSNLTPKVLEIDGDTLYCFTRPQTRHIGKLIEYGFYTESINRQLEGSLVLLEVALRKKEEAFNRLELMNFNLHTIHAHQEHMLQNQQQYIKMQKKQIKKHRFQKVLIVLGAGTIATLGLLK